MCIRDSPGSVAFFPKIVDVFSVFDGVHALPEAFMLMNLQAFISGKIPYWLLFQKTIAVFLQIFKERLFEDKKTAIDETILYLLFFGKFFNGIFLYI